MKVSDEHWALAVEVFGGESEAKYMLVGAGLRRDCTLKLLDALVAERTRAKAAERRQGVGTFADNGEIDPP